MSRPDLENTDLQTPPSGDDPELGLTRGSLSGHNNNNNNNNHHKLLMRQNTLSAQDVVYVANEVIKHFPKTSLGNPGSLGLGAFALTTFMLSVCNTQLIEPKVANVVLPVALWYGGIAQVLAGMWEFSIANTFGATAFTSYGCFWLSFATLEYYILPTWSGATTFDKNQAVGLFLLSWTIFTAYMLFAALKLSNGLISVFVPLEVAFILLTAGKFASNENAIKAGGWFGILTAFLAWYCSAAIVINWSWKKELLPLGVIRPATPMKE